MPEGHFVLYAVYSSNSGVLGNGHSNGCMRGIQNICRLTQLTTRYAHHILSLFNTDTCNWNALGPAFLHRSDTVVKELLFLVFQPAICRAIRTGMANTEGDGVVQSRNFGWQPVLELTCDQMHCPGYKWLLFFPELKEFMKRQNFLTTRTLSARRVAGWNTKNNNSSTTESKPWRNAGPSAFQLQVSMLKSDKIWCAYLVVNCVSLRTFWMPLVLIRFPIIAQCSKSMHYFRRVLGLLVNTR